MSEELLQRGLDKNPEKFGKWHFYNIGSTSIKSLKEYNIIRSINYDPVERKKVDGIIVSHKSVIAIIEYKQPKEFKTKAQQEKAINQELEVAKKLGAKILIVIDTQETIWINPLTSREIRNEKGQILKDNFNTGNTQLPILMENIISSINEHNNQILPKKLVNPTDLAKQIWQDIWSVSGEKPENCLYTFIELFIFKYLSDLKVLEQGINFEHLLERYHYDLKDPDEAALEYYACTIRPQIKKLFPESKNDKTTIINGTIFVGKDQNSIKGYSSLFKKILNRFNNYGKLEHIDYDFKSQLFESFLKESISKKNWGQFFTPIKVVKAINEIVKDEIKEGMIICDPACGVGKFLLEPIKEKLDQFYKVENNEIKAKITIEGFDKGFDKDEQKTIILAKANMLIYFSDLVKENPGITEKFSELFNKSFGLKTNSILGTLSDKAENKYDLILTNPPYVTSGSSNLKDEIKKDGSLVNYYKINAIGVEGLFMEWIIKALKPGGKAYIVAPDGIFNRKNDKNLRKFIFEQCFIDGIISLPVNTFFTTNKKTYILCLTKKQNKAQTQLSPVFTYLVSEIGESRDIYRFDIEQNDLQEAVELFKSFKGNKQGFIKLNTDKRCKIQCIDSFEQNIENNWEIERLWSNQEKVELGILQEDEPLTISEFSYVFEKFSKTINTLQAKIKLLEKNKVNENYNFKEVAIGELFDLSIKTNSSKFTKVFIEKHKGPIPVYSASKNEKAIDYGYVQDNLKGVKYFNDCLTWNIDGSIGKVFFRKGRFSLSEKVIPLIIKDEYKNTLEKNYLKYVVENTLLCENFNFTHKAGKNKIKNITIKIPINSTGNFDVDKQTEIADNHKSIKEIKEEIDKEINKIEHIKLTCNY